MTSILGNQEQRKTKIDTERWKEHKRYYNNLERMKKKEENRPSEYMDLEGKLLKYNSAGEPILKIHPMAKTSIYVRSILDFDCTMQIFQSAGWNREEYSKEPINISYVYTFPDPTVGFGKEGIKSKRFEMGSLAYFKDLSYTVLTLNQFCAQQKISREMLHELNQWYNTNIPNRQSLEDLPF